MEFNAVVESLLRQEHEVVDGLRRVLRIERKLDRAAIRLDRDLVALRDVDLHRRRCRPLLLRHLESPFDRAATIPDLCPASQGRAPTSRAALLCESRRRSPRRAYA